MAYTCSAEETKLQKKLVPLNIVVCILCLVASISLLAAPLFSIDLGKIFSVITDVEAEAPDVESQESALYVEMLDKSSGSSEDAFSPDRLVKKLASSMEGVKFSVSTVTLGQMATSDDILYELLGQVVNSISDALTDTLISVAIPLLVDNSGVELTDEQVKTAVNKLKELDNVNNRADAEAKFGELLDTVGNIGGKELEDDVRAQAIEAFGDLFEKTYNSADGFSTEKMVCVYLSDNVLELKEPATSYEDILKFFLEGSDSAAGGVARTYASSSGSSIDEISSELDYAMEMLHLVFLISFLSMFFFVVIWFIQAVFAFARIFTPNKRFLMWYSKLFGFLPCFMFGVAPLIAGAVISSMVNDAMISTIFGAISSLTWISGACYIALWGVSIFWAFPIKRKIRKLRKEEEEKKGKPVAAVAEETAYDETAYEEPYPEEDFGSPDGQY